LWEIGEIAWLRDAYKTAFKGAYEFGNFTCCDRLIYAFAYYAPWSEAPGEYGIQLSILPPQIWDTWNSHIRLRLDASPFPSEFEYCRFLIGNPKFLRRHHRSNADIVDLARILTLILHIAQAGHDVSNLLAGTERLLREDLVNARERAKKAESQYYKDAANNTIEMLEWVLGKSLPHV
jgi:hypothetical protein